MSVPLPPSYETKNWPCDNEAPKRRGSLTIWFDAEMIWDAVPSGGRGRLQWAYFVEEVAVAARQVT